MSRSQRVLVITREMVEAGMDVLQMAGATAELWDGGAEVAEDVLAAMLELSDDFRSGGWKIQRSWQKPQCPHGDS